MQGGSQGFSRAQHTGDLVDGQRFAKEITLYAVAVLGAQKAQLLGRFNAFGNHVEAEPAGKRDDGADDGVVVSVYRQVFDEGAIDL